MYIIKIFGFDLIFVRNSLPLVVVEVVHLVDPVWVHRDVDLAIDLALADTWEAVVGCPLGRPEDALAANKLRILLL